MTADRKNNGGKQDPWLSTESIGLEGKVETDPRNPCAHVLWKLNRFSAAGGEPRLKRTLTPAKCKVQIQGENGETGRWRSLKQLGKESLREHIPEMPLCFPGDTWASVLRLSVSWGQDELFFNDMNTKDKRELLLLS